MPRVVIIAMDGSRNSKMALEWYLQKCWKPDDDLHGVIVKQPVSLPALSLKGGMNIPVEEWQKRMTEVNAVIKDAEEEFSAMCKQITKKVLTLEILSGLDKDPGKAICDCAKSYNSDLIVMGTRGLNTIRRTLLGSVSDYVLHHAEVPCAIVPMKDKEAAEK